MSNEQKSTSHNPRSTVGTVTEIYDYLRLLFARAGEPRCPTHDIVLAAQTVSQMVDQILALPEGTRLMLLAPVVQERKGEHHKLLEELRAQGYVRARIAGEVAGLDAPPALDLRKKRRIEVVLDRAHQIFDTPARPGRRGEIAVKILKEVCERLNLLINVGLDYLTLDRRADTLSGGEAQRIRLASQIGAGLVGVMYVLDAPSIGLHQRDNQRLLDTLKHLRGLGNTVIVVEHDADALRAADYVVDMGPGAGEP